MRDAGWRKVFNWIRISLLLTEFEAAKSGTWVRSLQRRA
jgi:hypothetical protein